MYMKSYMHLYAHLKLNWSNSSTCRDEKPFESNLYTEMNHVNRVHSVTNSYRFRYNYIKEWTPLKASEIVGLYSTTVF